MMKSKMAALDMAFVRAQYPKTCWEWSFFDNAGGTYVPTPVIDRITTYMRKTKVQPGPHFPVAAQA